MSAPLFRKVLIANRGEIALRVIRACREMGISTVAVYSTADEHSLHVKLADEAVCIGPPRAKLSYLNIASILSAADITGADAIHPGYGFLSENAEFAKLCQACKITFIGPSAANIEEMGDKTRARRIAREAGVPLLPGTLSAVSGIEEAVEEAEKIGYPIILKAAAGGGGKGIHVVYSEDQLRSSFERVSSEAGAAFGNPAMYVEKYCEHPRHVEIQVLCDKHGNRISLGERDCTIQRRHQKMLEESPSPIMDQKLRESMSKAALKLCHAVKYENVGTVEFLVDEKKNFYFMEMNTRIQVEHPVTEMVTGLDLVKEQIRAAAGKTLKIKQSEIKIISHSIECRINAEDSERLAPSPGTITAYHLPGGMGVRVDSFVYDQYKVLPYYDSMIGKLIVHAPTRADAIAKMRQALDEFVVEGIKTNIAFHKKILSSKKFREASYDTHFLEEFLPKYE
ncbi:MAG: acetyl-CoA carboxylase biotin carboxylase subunit [Bdellovibrionales bacterium RIFOXYC1_FULL_54_43]|nr:MAG: acetyl-CoA carboxylase biotin carboxylase subunit [Bdellovibrionales bacterium RIFOXYC1_FULL_54_43]OFZ79995.1 MAG: acetyl-CoA carboxylase biotin carboxylase subunit [Bdellovibrionales bacterium RIFOXYD1_FULL_55_31]